MKMYLSIGSAERDFMHPELFPTIGEALENQNQSISTTLGIALDAIRDMRRNGTESSFDNEDDDELPFRFDGLQAWAEKNGMNFDWSVMEVDIPTPSPENDGYPESCTDEIQYTIHGVTLDANELSSMSDYYRAARIGYHMLEDGCGDSFDGKSALEIGFMALDRIDACGMTEYDAVQSAIEAYHHSKEG